MVVMTLRNLRVSYDRFEHGVVCCPGNAGRWAIYDENKLDAEEGDEHEGSLYGSPGGKVENQKYIAVRVAYSLPVQHNHFVENLVDNVILILM